MMLCFMSQQHGGNQPTFASGAMALVDANT